MIEVRGLSKKYGKKIIYDKFNLDIEEGDVTVILGSSGCGKTTLLKLLGNLEKADSGQIRGINTNKLSMVFQEDRLIPWLTVKENIRFVLNDESKEIQSQETKINQVLKLLQLEEEGEAQIQTLSGGMQRRVALARALVYPYDVLLLDEPFKGMDKILKEQVIQTIKSVWQSEQKTIIIITHDEAEAGALGDAIYYFYEQPIRYKRIK